VDLKNVITLGAMDPFLILRVGKEEFHTKPHKDAGRNPTWNQAFIFNLDGKEEQMHIVAMTKGHLSDDHIGRCDIPISSLVNSKGETSFDIVEVNNFKKVAGHIVLKVEFKGQGALPALAQFAQPQATPQVVQQQAPQVVVVQKPAQQVVYQQPQVVYAQPQYVMAQPGQPQMVYQQPMYQQQQPQQQPMYQPQPGQQVVYMQPGYQNMS